MSHINKFGIIAFVKMSNLSFIIFKVMLFSNQKGVYNDTESCWKILSITKKAILQNVRSKMFLNISGFIEDFDNCQHVFNPK